MTNLRKKLLNAKSFLNEDGHEVEDGVKYNPKYIKPKPAFRPLSDVFIWTEM